MQSKKVKYSIIVPVKNSLKYLPECIYSIIRQNYSDYELIISDDHSDDGTAEYLNTLNHPNIKVIHPDRCLSGVEHFEFAVKHASGEWLLTLGGDDGLQPYFFKLADILTDVAVKENIRTIASRRANYFWDGLQEVRGDIAVIYSANLKKKYCIKNTSKEMIMVLLGFGNDKYFRLPTMYMTSLFHSSIVNEVIQKQEGKLLNFAFPDVSFVAIGTSLEKKYIDSTIPLSWVGTSPKSVFRTDSVKKQLNRLPERCGDYTLYEHSLYYWGALLSVPHLLDGRRYQLIVSKWFMSLMFGNILGMMLLKYVVKITKKDIFISRKKLLQEVIEKNKCCEFIVALISFPCFFINVIFLIFKRLIVLFYKIFSKIGSKTYILLRITRKKDSNISMTDASNIVFNKICF
jgi:glycosyltransferase involved in cell wall biosynthesis